MKILVIGAGAVGQVYARHLAAGGADVSFLVRAAHAGEHDGFLLYPLRSKGHFDPARLRPKRVFTSLDDAKTEAWDAVWLCVPTTALVKSWVEEIARATGDATLVFFPAGIGVVERLGLPAERCVTGLISMMSYFAPMAGDPRDLAPGVAYWFPPLAPTRFSGADARRDAVVAALKRGGCPAARGDVTEGGAFGSAVLMPHVVGLEGAGWSYAPFAREGWLRDSVAATREAIAAAAAHLGVARPFFAALLFPWTVRVLLGVVRLLAPLDVATFFETHFTKVRRQTEVQMAQYIALATKHGCEATALARLSDRVFGEGWRERAEGARDSAAARQNV